MLALLTNFGIRLYEGARAALKELNFQRKAINAFVNPRIHTWWKGLNA